MLAAGANKTQSLPQQRKEQRTAIMALVKKYAEVLVPFSEVMQ